MERKNVQNNLCECYREDLGYSVWVQSDETGLWFNFNDIVEIFRLGNNRRLKQKRTISEEKFIYVDFDRCNGEGQVHEMFIAESEVHNIIALNKEATFQAEVFIYDIITDYNLTCVNLNQQKLNTGQRIALHALRNEVKHHKEVTTHYMKMLKDNTKIPEKFEEYSEEVEKEIVEIENNKPIYNNEKLPNDVKREESRKRQKEEKERNDNEFNKVNNSKLGKAVDYIKQINEFYWDEKIKEFDDENEYLTGEQYEDIQEVSWDDVTNILQSALDEFDKLESEEIDELDIIELNWEDIL